MDFPYFSEITNALGVEGLFIENLTGTHRHQMLFSYQEKSLEKINNMIESARTISESAGVPILRNKVELPFNTSVQSEYHEFHVKLYAPRFRDEQILKFCDENLLACGWDFNRSNLQNRKWFITSRDYHEAINVEHVFTSMIKKIQREFGNLVTGSIIETCVFDDNPAIDEGWL